MGVLLPNHHQGYIDWETYQANQSRIDANVHLNLIRQVARVREGRRIAARFWLSAASVAAICIRTIVDETHLLVITAPAKTSFKAEAFYCLTVGAFKSTRQFTDAFLKAVTPASVEITELAIQRLETDHDAALEQWRLAVERARYEADRAERQYRAVEPENRMVARGLESNGEAAARPGCR